MRLYNGCPDDELKAIIDRRAATMAEAASLCIVLTWFPVEERWMASRSIDAPEGYKELSGFHHTREGALEEAKKRV
jgi:hypothetical protein